MAWDESGTKREVESLRKRYPRRKPLALSESMEEQSPLERVRDAESLRKMEEGYNRSPQPYAKGGMTRGDGCCRKGHTKGKVM